MKKTAVAPSNIAFIKYWGRKDEILRLPVNGSISMNLSGLLTTTTVGFDQSLKKDLIIINGLDEDSQRVVKHLDRIRKMSGINYRAKVVSKNNFPSSTGLSSSASGFAALSLAASRAAGLSLPEKELSILARLGSGSACRSVPDGFVEWVEGTSSESSFAKPLFKPDFWDIVDIVAVVSNKSKDVSSSRGQTFAKSSPFFKTRLKNISDKIQLCKKYLAEKNFKKFGELIEQEALELHSIYLTSSPSLIYLTPESLKIIQMVKKWREGGLLVYFTLNTGQDVHLICQRKDEKKLSELLSEIHEIKKTIINHPAVGARLSENHLF